MRRRDFLLNTATCTALLTFPSLVLSKSNTLLTRTIPSTGESLPCVGMGTWITFDVSTNQSNIDNRTEVLKQFFINGGGMIDSSPMYGTAQTVLGKCFQQLKPPKSLFSATKVWTPGEWLGIQQMEASQELWGLDPMDLMQVHNIVDWKTHLKTLREWKESKRIRYLGVTTSHGRRHEDIINITTLQYV